MTNELKIGLATPVDLWSMSIDAKHRMLEDAWAAGVNHIFMADHVSFRDGSGTDGFVEIAALSQLHAEMSVMISIYLLPLRHPLPVARQLATMHKIASGRMLFGVGIGGEDRHEVEICGVDPRTRGRRTNECLEIVRRLMLGESVDFEGEFFNLSQARIKPTVGSSIPIIVGGRSNAALVRTARFGDGWIGTWCSVRRYREALSLVQQAASETGRGKTDWLHGYQPWVGVADSREEGRKLVAEAMEDFYHVPFEKFERYVPYGTPDDVANDLAPFVDAGCSIMNLKVVAGNDSYSIAATKIIAQSLRNR
jgi:alkanesulfonate monooxygenase SsuD/methylene tetrahydromethanopterin reductase-like flavin-dependent oxidoreductase (luciferase family)